MIRQFMVALAALALLTTTAASANAQRQLGKPKFEDIKLQTGMAQSGSPKNTVRGGGFFQIHDQGG
jgi:hypothetical protein